MTTSNTQPVAWLSNDKKTVEHISASFLIASDATYIGETPTGNHLWKTPSGQVFLLNAAGGIV